LLDARSGDPAKRGDGDATLVGSHSQRLTVKISA